MASLARKTLLRLSKSKWLADHVMRRRFVLRAVKKFMPGEEVTDALDAAAKTFPALNRFRADAGPQQTLPPCEPPQRG